MFFEAHYTFPKLNNLLEFRYDYEGVESGKAKKMMSHLQDLINKQTLKEKKYGEYAVDTMDNFSYTAPVDGSVTQNQVSFSY